MARIAVAGFQHETNTFAPTKADFDAFAIPGAWPGLLRGDEVIAGTRGRNLPIAGFCDAAEAAGHTLLPLSWTAASPSAQVTDDAFTRIANQILEDLSQQVDLDAVYLDLHGAMVTESLDDGEGELLAQVRALVGDQLPVVASLDLHANVSPAMVDRADALIAYRTYPHVDMAETGARALHHLDGLLNGTAGRKTAFRQIPFLIPLTAGCTVTEPGQGVYARLAEIEAAQPGVTLSFNCGFPPADVPDAGGSVIAHARDQATADAAADDLAAYVTEREGAFGADILHADSAVARAIELVRGGHRPVVLADTQDNPGAGGNGDTTGLLRALLDQGADNVLAGLLHDPEAAQAAHDAGEGAVLSIALGGRTPGDRPLETNVKVAALGNGQVTGVGPFYRGARLQLGSCALLELADGAVRVAVVSRKLQAADRAPFLHLGADPAAAAILALKSSVHFRADFAPIASDILIAAAPGPNPVDHTQLAYHHLRGGVRLMPNGPTFLGASRG
ncbi:microcystin degradation protein MlrC [Rhodovibrio salinarum]|uniref:Microcystinase C n=1 Tax=Rhodovibrio salinarum TaxID=1087 RepID=A0A934UZE8_9PROT|nr:M81 family metallopeptidase [Rhodovibrio salinarum]MBK1696658.1 microcystin degradation protein MlrC [Rhodovibrio salinarum]